MEKAPLHQDIAKAPEGGQAFWLTCADKTRIRIALWRGGDCGTFLIFPGRTEYIEKYGQTVGQCLRRGFSAAVIDWRGQGLSDRPEGKYQLGHVEKFSDYQLDIAALMQALKEQNFPKPNVLLAHSMGGAIGLRALHLGLDVDRVIFSAPMWGISMVPGKAVLAKVITSIALKIGLGRFYAPSTGPKNYVLQQEFPGNVLTNDPETYKELRSHLEKHQELGLGGPSLQWLAESIKECEELRQLPAPDINCLCFLGTNEAIVDTDAIKEIMAKWPRGKLVEFEHAQHEILMERPEKLKTALNEADVFLADLMQAQSA